MYSVCLMVSKLSLSKYVEAGFSSDRKHEKFAVGARVLVNTHNVVISHCCFAEDRVIHIMLTIFTIMLILYSQKILLLCSKSSTIMLRIFSPDHSFFYLK